MNTNNFDETVLILARDREAATSAAARLARAGRLILTGADAAVGSLVLARMPITSLHADAQLEGPFSAAVLELVTDARRRAKACDIVLTSSERLTAAWCAEAKRRGASEIVYSKERKDRKDRKSSIPRSDEGKILHIPAVDELIASAHLRPAFQPILDVRGDSPSGYGYESLARFDDEALSFCDPQFLFDYARLTGKTAELELACLRRTLRQARALPRGAKLFINLHPHVLHEGERLVRTLVEEATDNGVELKNVVLEITEQEKLTATPSVCETFESLRGHGIEFALDDVGIAYSHLDRIECVKPSFLKVSHEFGTDFEKNPVRRKIIGNILSLAHDFECEVVLEGIETAATSGAAHDIGARYAQGFFYARPQRAAAAFVGHA
ncbi:MAG TPA: EAL domain-containing protein [Thermoanaerobaculia bacterium]|jgi:EAL domain-containing protein (putative c-di-GMP-specific phosphodiesterase class I)